MREPDRVTLHVLGRFALVADSASDIRVGIKKGRALLAYLGMQPERRADRQHLANVLWGDRIDAQARQNLRQCLVSLRRELAPAAPDLLILDGDVVALRAGALAVDAQQFMTLAQSSDLSDLTRAADLYRGEFLPAIFVDEAFDSWAAALRSQLESIAAGVFQACAERADALGESNQAVAMVQRLVGLDPLREDWQRLLLRLYARHRSRDAALSHAAAWTALLKTELGVAPDAATEALLNDIRTGAIPCAPPRLDRVLPATPATPTPDVSNGRQRAAADQMPVSDAVSPPEAAPSGSSRQRAPSFAGPMALALVMSAVAAWVVMTDGDTATPARRNPEQSWQSPGKTPGVSAERAVMPVVVLPFAADADTGQKIADGITDDLINSLSRFTGLRVISRQTAFTYKGHPVDVAAVGAELGVRYVVEGSLRTEGSHLHVNAQLVDATNRVQVWSDRFERNESHRFDVQDEIVKRLARALQVSLTLAEGQRKSERSAREPAVGELINAGWSIQYRGPTRDNLAQSRASFEEALRREPGLPVAMIGVASALTTAVLNAMADDARHDLDRAELLLNSALQGDPTSYQAHYWKGLLSKARGRYELALPSLLRAIDLNPSASYAHAQVGHVLVRLGRVQEGMGHISYAMRLSPKDPALGWFHMFAGEAELELGRDEAARESILRSIALMPKNPSTYGFLAAIYALRGDKTSAARYIAEFRKLSPAPAIDRIRDRLEAVAADPASYRTRLLQGLSLALAS